MKKIFTVLVIMLFATKAYALRVANLPADIALNKLKEGNYRFASSQMKHPNLQKSRREKLLNGQHPFAVILSCSDSRVVPELIFDQGLGDVFVIRNAGNILDENTISSIDYAIRNFGVNLIIVLNHEYCDEVGIVMREDKKSLASQKLEESIMPAVNKCKEENSYAYVNVIKTHAKLDATNVMQDKSLSAYINKHDIKVVPAYYSISTGEVEFLK